MEILSRKVPVWVTQGYPKATPMLLIDFVIEIKVFHRKNQENLTMDHTNAVGFLST
jgi:hypothetical protein